MKDDPTGKPETSSGVSRRDFMKISGVGVALPLVLGPKMVEAAGEKVAAARDPAGCAARQLRFDRGKAGV